MQNIEDTLSVCSEGEAYAGGRLYTDQRRDWTTLERHTADRAHTHALRRQLVHVSLL